MNFHNITLISFLFERFRMKTYSTMFRILTASLVVLAIAISSTNSQTQINGNLPGDGTVGTVEVQTADGTQYNVTGTAGGVYVKNAATSDIDYIKVYSPPPGKTIQRIGPKVDTTGVFTVRLNRSEVLVVLNDGTIVKLNFTNYSTSQGVKDTTLGKPNTSGSSTSGAKVVGDALYSLGAYVYVSRDTGKTWQIDSAGLGSGVYIRDLALDSLEYVYAATTSGLFKQHPDSSVWQKVATLISPTSLQTVYIDRLNRIFVSGNPNVGGGVVMSTDNGGTWIYDTMGIGTLGLSAFTDDIYGNIYASGGSGTIYKSAGGTGAWTRIDAGILAITVNPPSINAMVGDSILVAATGFGVFVSTNQGSTWQETNGGINAGTFYGFAKNSPDRMFVSTDLGIFYKDAGDTAWHKSFPPSGYQAALQIYKDSLQTLYTILPNPDIFSFAPGPIYKSTDNGATWITDTMGLSATIGRVFFVDERGGEHIASSVSGFSYYARAYAQDSTGKWILDTSGIPNVNYSASTSFGTDRGGMIYLSGSYTGGPRVFSRPITGGTWLVDTVGLPSSVHYFNVMKPGIDGEVFGTNNVSLYRHSAGVWSQVPLPSSHISKFTVDKKGTIFVVTTTLSGFFYIDAGISMSTDNGSTWTALTHDTIQVDALHSRGDTSYALLEGGGLYTLTRNGIVTSVLPRQGTQLPSTYELSQNYPNPFNPTTDVRFRVAGFEFVTLTVYDVLGQRVATLVSEVKQPGEYSVKWDASRFPSGVYFYQLRTKSFMDVKKMVLMK
jgi:hypothetical protein